MKHIFLLLLLLSSTPFLTSLSANAQTLTITDSQGVHHFDASPKRVITLPWSITETVIELGVTPLAVAGIEGYEKWVVQPAIPEGVNNIGVRDEPNIELIAELKPDVIIVSFQQRDLIETLSSIAPVLYFETFSANHNNYEMSKKVFMELAKLFERETYAQQRLADVDKRLKVLKNTLQQHFKGTVPKVTPLRFNNTTLAWIYGDNAMPQYALEALGIQAGLPQPKSQWGITQKKIIDLGKVNEGVVLYFEPYDRADQLFNAPLWRAMPFVRKNQFASVSSTWSYGGAMSILYLAEAMTESLMQIDAL